MKQSSKPPNEAERLLALAQYDILDSGPEREFDALTKLAAQMLGVPIALVSIVDADRQWFKSRYGLDALETARDVSFCGHVVSADAPLVIDDTLADERFADNPLVTGHPRIRFYAGIPLRTPQGFVLGTLCAIDHDPRQLSDAQRETLELLAGQAVALLELRRSGRLLREERAALLAQGSELEQSEGRMRALFDGMSEGVVLQDASGAVLTCNPAAEAILGLSKEQITGRSSFDPRWRCVQQDGSHFPGEEHPAMVCLRSGKALTNVVMGVAKADGGLTWISINARPLFRGLENKPYAVITTFRDISEQRAAAAFAERLARQERLITTGTLAAGVGHEINNPLTYVLANLDFSLEELRSIAGGSPSARLKELIGVLGEAREGAERVRKIVRGLRALAREDGPPVPTPLAPVLDISINMAMHEIRQKASIRSELDLVAPVLADEARLTQVLVNILVNAAQAFSISDIAVNQILVRVAAKPAEVEIAIIDNGPGIPPDVLPRIFDPFFTTKAIGQGTGLGLSISHSIVTGLGGSLTCETTPGKGTTFRIVLPTAAPDVPQAAKPQLVPRGRVLVVDDDELVLRSIGRILSADHELLLMDDPREAWKLLERDQQFDVIFCDLMMPHLSGVELYRLVEACDPKLCERFVFVTGGATRGDLATFLSEVPNERVEKPFSMQNIRGIAKRFVRNPQR